MTSDDRTRARRIFTEVSGLPAREREAALADACRGDESLRREVEALIEAGAAPGEPIADATADWPAAAGAGPDAPERVSRESVGQRIGRYKLLEQIGEGGFGSVWAAEQREPVKRRVALKIIKLGMDTAQVIARFEAERQALAMMDHPNIARVLDAGATETGRPFFAMELVKGVPILEYCDTERLDTAARLGLFTLVCNAIQHAHQKGIIHRDIKPSNVLVTLHDGVPVPKVIDFGIAKATNQELTEKTIYTQHRQMIGTPAYMSPEQAEMSGLDIDTRSDIYSLGVLLYELLTGTTPFTHEELAGAGFEGMTRMIREVEPHRPSARLSALRDTATRTAERRGADVEKLRRLLRGDLDWIVMKCLEKDRTRRYDTANGLAADVRRHLDDEPVSAGPPSAGYTLRKFVKRNRGQVIAVSVIAATLVLGVVGTTAGLVWALDEKSRADTARDQSDRERLAADEARRGAEAQLARSEEFKGFMVELLNSIEPDREFPERSLAIRELIDTAYEKLRDGTVRDADARAEVIELLADTAYRHTWYDIQISLRYALLDEALRSHGPESPRAVALAIPLAEALLAEGRTVEALRIVDQSMPAARALDESSGSPAFELGLLTMSAAARSYGGDFRRALDDLDQSLVFAEQLRDSRALFINHALRSRALRMLGRIDEALVASDAAKGVLDADGGATAVDDWIGAMWYANRAELMTSLGRHGEALDLFLEAAERRAQLTPDDFSPHVFRGGAAGALRKLGRTEEALRMATRAREGMMVTRAPESIVRDISRQILVMLAELDRDAEHDRELAEFLAAPGFPVVVYGEGAVQRYSPSGLMGETSKAAFDAWSAESPYEGEVCFEWRVEPGDSWVALGWLEPANDWGELPGGYDLTGADRLSFAARGARGGEALTTGIGLIDRGDYVDTLRERTRIELTTEWERFTIPLDGLDLSTVRCGFVIESELSGERQTVYFDDIRIE